MRWKLRRLACLATTTGRALLVGLHRRHRLAGFAVITAVICSTNTSLADEGGVSFWIPGLYGSLAAVQQVPGWAVGIVDSLESGERVGEMSPRRAKSRSTESEDR